MLIFKSLVWLDLEKSLLRKRKLNPVSPTLQVDALTTSNNNTHTERCNSRFFTISSLRREPSPTCTLKWPRRNRVQITCNMSWYVPRGTKGQLSYYVWQSLNRIYLSFILLAELSADEGGEETRVNGENPWRQASENATYKTQRFKPQVRTRTIALVAG